MEYNINVYQVTKYIVKMTLKCKDFETKHGFIHTKLKESVLYAINKSEYNNLWVDRSDIILTIEVFYINSNLVKLNKEIECYFEAKLITYDPNTHENASKKLKETINNFVKKSDNNAKRHFIRVS